MKYWNKLQGILMTGGAKLLALKVEDKLFHTGKAKAYIYEVLSTAQPADYPRLVTGCYQIKTCRALDLAHPRTYNEKMQWLKVYDSTPEKTKLADKYLVREWVREAAGEELLIPLLGVWDSFDEIPFDALPEKFVLKCNHGSAMNLIVEDKAKLNMAEAKAKFDRWLATDFASVVGLELQYRDIPRKIIAEQFVEELSGDLLDYKIHCFNGRPRIIQVIGDRDLTAHTGKEAFFDTDWKRNNLMYHTYEQYDIPPERPENLEEMLRIAERLSRGFYYVRVDLYDLEGHIKFGEMTFTPASGIEPWDSEEDALAVGGMIHLPTDS